MRKNTLREPWIERANFEQGEWKTMSKVDWSPLAARLRASKRIILGTHINADGDGLGSEIALHQFLKQSGADVRIVNCESAPEKYRFLEGSEDVEAYDPAVHSELVRNADLFLVLDNASVERLEKLKPDVMATKAFKACIDHHSAVNPFWDLSAVDMDACASGQLVHQLIKFMGGSINKAMAEALYVSYITDSGHFRYAKTTPEAHRVVAELMEIGSISPPRVFTEVYERTSKGMAALTGIALTSLEFEFDDRVGCMQITRDQVRQWDAEEEDTGDLVNLALAIKGIVAGALFREMPDGQIKISLRSKGEIDVSVLASSFSGGGHKNAAGILMPGPLADAIRKVMQRMEPFLDRAVALPVTGSPGSGNRP
jgi:phosphoesterase RecJ-like protein